jgi:SAM-dependent methyltransferase/uncharacterized protein YbaR (Trm112 family)
LRRSHLEALAPLCPVCRARGAESPLALSDIYKEEGDHLVEGALRCTDPACLSEFPILDGIPLLLPNLRAYVAGAIDQIQARADLAPETESLLGDCCGPGSPYDVTRQHLSTYAWDHWADLDPEEVPEEVPADSPGSVVRLLERALALAGDLPSGPLLDLGCAAGRTTFALANQALPGCQVLGVDLGFPLLRVAATALRQGRVRYPRRRVGVVYERRELPVQLPGSESVDFWAADATALPFRDGTFAAIVALNVLDCVGSPYDLLATLPHLLAPGGKALLTCPYDWSPGATPVEAWIGGHSQRGPGRGASEPALRALLTPGAHPAAIPGLRIVAEVESIPWRVRLHDRSAVEYRVHLVVVERDTSIGS